MRGERRGEGFLLTLWNWAILDGNFAKTVKDDGFHGLFISHNCLTIVSVGTQLKACSDFFKIALRPTLIDEK
jgi:hypothetical protein